MLIADSYSPLASVSQTILGAVLLVGCLPFHWIAVTTPLSVQVNDQVRVNFLGRSRTFSLADVRGICRSTERTRHFTPETAILSSILPYQSYWSRKYDVCVLQLKERKQIKFQVSSVQLSELESSIHRLMVAPSNRTAVRRRFYFCSWCIRFAKCFCRGEINVSVLLHEFGG